jgi:hypothetical protein
MRVRPARWLTRPCIRWASAGGDPQEPRAVEERFGFLVEARAMTEHRRRRCIMANAAAPAGHEPLAGRKISCRSASYEDGSDAGSTHRATSQARSATTRSAFLPAT